MEDDNALARDAVALLRANLREDEQGYDALIDGHENQVALMSVAVGMALQALRNEIGDERVEALLQHLVEEMP